MRKYRQQRPQGTRKKHRNSGAHHDAAKDGSIVEVPESGSNAFGYRFHRRQASSDWPLPAKNHRYHTEERSGIEHESGTCPSNRDDHSCQPRTDRTREIELNTIESKCGSQISFGHHVRKYCLPSRGFECCPD